MRALRLKAEGNGGWTKRGGATGDTLPRAQPRRGHWPLPEEPKILISSALPPFSGNLTVAPLTQTGPKSDKMWGCFDISSLGGSSYSFFFPFFPAVCLAQTFGHKCTFPPHPSLKICSRVCPLEFILQWKLEKPEKKHHSAGPCWLLGIKASYFLHFQPNLHCFPLQSLVPFLLFLAVR